IVCLNLWKQILFTDKRGFCICNKSSVAPLCIGVQFRKHQCGSSVAKYVANEFANSTKKRSEEYREESIKEPHSHANEWNREKGDCDGEQEEELIASSVEGVGH